MSSPYFIFILFLTILFLPGRECAAQQNGETESIVAEGKAIYRSEMASWLGTDIFLEKFADQREHIGGYFSYAAGDLTHCLFFSKDERPVILAIISFDSTFNAANAVINNKRKTFTATESQLFDMRQRTLATINSDTLFRTYSETSLNLVPMIEGHDNKVYVLTGSQKNGEVIFGNDYLVSFEEQGHLISVKQLHRNIMPVQYGDRGRNKEVFAGMHTHQPETGKYITPTDVATLMLYEKLAGWRQYIVISDKYVSIWNCEKDELVTLTREAWDKNDCHASKAAY